MLLIRVSIVLRSLTRARAVTDVNFWSSEQEENPHQWAHSGYCGRLCIICIILHYQDPSDCHYQDSPDYLLGRARNVTCYNTIFMSGDVSGPGWLYYASKILQGRDADWGQCFAWPIRAQYYTNWPIRAQYSPGERCRLGRIFCLTMTIISYCQTRIVGHNVRT